MKSPEPMTPPMVNKVKVGAVKSFWNACPLACRLWVRVCPGVLIPNLMPRFGLDLLGNSMDIVRDRYTAGLTIPR